MPPARSTPLANAETRSFVQTITCTELIGRDSMVAALQHAVDVVSGGQRQIVLITGEAGIGKSRLVAEARSYAAAHGFLLLQGACFAQDSACPYAPLLDVLRARIVAQPWAISTASAGPFISELAPLLPDLLHLAPDAPPLPLLDSEQKKRRLFEALAHFLIPRAEYQPVLLSVEDLHWSDEATLDFLLYLLRRSATEPLLLVATYRSEEVGPRLRHWLAQLDRERLAQELSLAPLTRDEVAAMMRAIFAQPRPVRADFLDAIYALAEGNPFYVEELLKSLVVAGDIFYADGAWDRKPLRELRIPRSLYDAVQGRAAGLSPAARDMLALAAVIGPRFDFTLLQQVAQTDERELLGLIKELIAAQLVVEESVEQFAFRHALTRQAIYSDLLGRERLALHRTVAETTERIYAASLDAHVADLAYHFFAASAWERVLHYAQRAGEGAQALEAPHAAIEQWTRVLHAAHNVALAPAPEVYLARGRAYETLGDFDYARADYEEALSLARAAKDGRVEWQALIDLGLLWAGRDYQQTGACFGRALELAQTLADPLLHGHSLNRLGNWMVNTGQTAEALRAHHTALELFEAQQDTQSIAETLDWLGMANALYGDVQACNTCYSRAIDLFRELGDNRGLSSSLAVHGVFGSPGLNETLVSSLRTYEVCTGDIAEALRLASQIGWRAGQAYAECCAGITYASFGELGTGLVHAYASLRIATDIDHQQWQAAAYWTLGQLYIFMLAPDRAIEALEAGLALATAVGSTFWVESSTSYLAFAHLLNDDVLHAEAALVDTQRSSGLPASMRKEPLERYPATSRQSLTGRRMVWACGELALAQGAPEQALQMAEQLIASAPGVASGQPIPALLKLKGAALLALNRLDEAMDALQHALRGTHQRGACPLLWRILCVVGTTYQLLGRQDQAQRSFGEAREVIDGLAATIDDTVLRDRFLDGALARLPKEKATAAGRRNSNRLHGLTAREHEVALLIGRGRSNREIADLLVVGERTIETHVSNILAKLGYTSRREIAAWVIDKGLQDTPE